MKLEKVPGNHRHLLNLAFFRALSVHLSRFLLVLCPASPDDLSYHQDFSYHLPYVSSSQVYIFSPYLSPESQSPNSKY